MDNNKSKILTIIAAVISLIGVFFMVRIIMVGDEAIETDVANQGIVSGFVYFAVALLIIATLITVVLSVGNLVKNPQNLKKTLLGLGVLIVLLLVTHFTASDELATDAIGQPVVLKNISGDIVSGDEAKSVTKWVAGLITFTGILGAVGLGAIGFGIVKNISK